MSFTLASIQFCSSSRNDDVVSAHERGAIRRRVRESTVAGRWIAAGLLAAALPLPGHAGTEPVERPGGMAEVVIDGAEVGLPASLVQAVEAAVADQGDDPEGLAAAMEKLVAEAIAAGACDTSAACERLATAIVALAVSRSNRQADTVGAIVQGVSAAVPQAKTDTLVAAVGSAQERRAADPADTAQPPRSVSPVQ